MLRFGLLLFRSPLLKECAPPSVPTNKPLNVHRNSINDLFTEREGGTLFSFPPGTEMFHFPGFAPHPTYVGGSSRFARWSFLIRTSPDQRLLGTSPKRIAASRVLHRHVKPRHPPYALI